ncbi:PREDICTED: pre-mRNA-splicing factor SYF2-like [Priapulus caudatus]|uniref:Pre-mRNA-splicing factor SYF2 n=1 Tax=Priapulus caudatus TaxID=37621 RepID=A0ABM1EHC1_PRICU|nr:PREDICTED: pre-mRNA-splicing factor SYF2-like [Priapulus caudatus]
MSEVKQEDSAGEISAGEKRAERMKKLKELHLRRNEARKINHQEVVEEDRKKKLPANFETKRKWAERSLEEERKRGEAVTQGEDYDRVKLLTVQADEAERWERHDKRKKNPDQGFSDYETATKRQYDRLVRGIKVDDAEVARQKEQLGDDFYAPPSASLIHGTHKPTEQAIERMSEDIEKQIEKRNKYSRRRAYDDDADIDYINERNAKFNKKLERFYGQYTAETKQNLERGTAV